MLRRSRWLLVAGTLSLLLGPSISRSQNYLTNGGEPSFSAPEPMELGFTDTANGQIHLEIPLGSFPQRGSNQPIAPRLVYNSTLWWINTDSGGNRSWMPPLGNSAGYFGWEMSPNFAKARVGVFTDSGCQSHGVWTDEGGTQRFFPLTTVYSCTTSTNGYASDGSGYRMYYRGAAGVFPSLDLYAPDGSLVCHADFNNYNISGTCNKREDNNGNQLNVAASTDTIGRVLPMAGIPTSRQIAVPNSQGGTSVYTVTLATISIKSAFGQSGVSEYTGSTTVIQSVTLPDSTQFTFKYDCDSTLSSACSSPHGQSGYYGLLTSVTTPTGGTASYSWQTFADSYGNKARWLYYKSDAGGFTSFYPAVITTCSATQVDCQQKLTVSRNSGQTVYTFRLNNGAWPITIQTLDSSSSVLSTVNNTYDFSQGCPFYLCHGAAYIRLQTTKTTVSIPNGGSITKQTQFTYDTAQTSNVTALKEWRFYSGTAPSFPAIADRTTYTLYLTTGTNNINRPLKVTVCNNAGSDADCSGGGSKVSQTMYTYDSYSSCAAGLKSVINVVNHDDANFGTTYTARGNPTKIQRWVSGSTLLSTSLCYDTTGQVLLATDPANNSTTYDYTDNFFNETGPASMSPYSPSAATNAFPKTISKGGLTLTRGYYYGSGRQAVFTDPNNASTYSYYSDSFDRPTQTVFPIGWKLTRYTSPTQYDAYTPVNDATASTGCTSCRQSELNLDGFGRKINEKLVNAPGGAINIDTTYDGNGRISTVSHAYVSPSDPSHVFETFSYDGLNRKTSVMHPDNQSSKVFYGPQVTGFGVNGVAIQQALSSTYGSGYPIYSQDEAGKARQQWLDGFGRIIEVDEPTTAQTASVGSVTITGGERTITWYPCGTGSCPTTAYDYGSFSVTINGFTVSPGYGQNTTLAGLVSSIASGFNAASSPVTATVSSLLKNAARTATLI